jgi:hypothetical protein
VVADDGLGVRRPGVVVVDDPCGEVRRAESGDEAASPFLGCIVRCHSAARGLAEKRFCGIDQLGERARDAVSARVGVDERRSALVLCGEEFDVDRAGLLKTVASTDRLACIIS